MNRLTKKLVLSILTVVLTVVALGTTTFAWFTLGNTVELDKFQAEIIADSGIEISLDKITWVNVLTNEMIQEYLEQEGTREIGGEEVPIFKSLNHVTSVNGYTFTNLEGGAPAGDYVQITLYFRSAESGVIIQWTDATLDGEGKTWNADASFIHSDGEAYGPNDGEDHAILVNAANAVRISVYNSSETDTYKGVKVYELPENDTEGEAYNTVLGDGSSLLENGAVSYYKVKTTNYPAGYDSTNKKVTAGTVATFTDFEDEGYAPEVLTFGEVAGYGKAYGGSLDIFVYIEGFDPEAYNSILGMFVTVSLTFQKKPVTP